MEKTIQVKYGVENWGWHPDGLERGKGSWA